MDQYWQNVWRCSSIDCCKTSPKFGWFRCHIPKLPKNPEHSIDKCGGTLKKMELDEVQSYLRSKGLEHCEDIGLRIRINAHRIDDNFVKRRGRTFQMPRSCMLPMDIETDNNNNTIVNNNNNTSDIIDKNNNNTLQTLRNAIKRKPRHQVPLSMSAGPKKRKRDN